MHVHTHTHVCVYARVCMHAVGTYIWRPEVILGAVPQNCHPPYFLRHILSLGLRLANQTRLGGHMPSDPHPANIGVTSMCPHAGLLILVLEIKFRSHAYEVKHVMN